MKQMDGKRGTWVRIENRGEVFLVTGSSGYRAELRACLRDECQAGRFTPCAIRPGGVTHQHAVNGKNTVNVWLAHIKTHCHGWHWPSVESFAERVLKTYGTGARHAAAKVGVARYGQR